MEKVKILYAAHEVTLEKYYTDWLKDQGESIENIRVQFSMSDHTYGIAIFYTMTFEKPNVSLLNTDGEGTVGAVSTKP